MLIIILMQFQIILLKKNVDKHSTKYEGDNQDKSSEFIFDDSEEKIETKKLKILKYMQKTKENPKQSAIIFLREWRLAKFTLTLNALKKKKRIWCLAHQYLTF